MQTTTQIAPVSKGMLWTGRIISALPVFMFLFGGIYSLTRPPAVVEGFKKFGYPEQLLPVLGIVEICCAVLYLIPRTSVLGAILLTGYLGGATATHVRLNDPAFVMPVALGVLVWLGLFFREPRLRVLIPFRA